MSSNRVRGALMTAAALLIGLLPAVVVPPPASAAEASDLIFTVAGNGVSGAAGDGDHDGDGRTDVAVFRPSSGPWFVKGGITTGWGNAGDRPLPLPAAIRQAFFS